MDALTAIENFASGIFSSGIRFFFVWGEALGVVCLILLLVRARSQTAAPLSPGKFIGGQLICAAMVSLPSLINAAGAQLGFQSTSFDAIAYVPASTFGEASGAANAVLSLVRLSGVGFFLSGLNMYRRSSLDGHTALSASENNRAATVKVVAGTAMVFAPQLIDKLLASLKIAF